MDYSQQLSQLSYLHGKPDQSGDIRTTVEDFEVEEILGFEPTGSGEHMFVWVEKRGENTVFVAKQLAQVAGIAVRDVGYSGLKDRHGVTRQWFSIPVGLNRELDFCAINSEKITVLKQQRNIKKLRLGSHKSNRFILLIRHIANVPMAMERLAKIKQTGVPNYFGSQRFGHHSHNLVLAEKLFAGEKIKDRKVRGLVISAARSYLFNLLVSERIKQGYFDTPLEGDLFLFGAGGAYFTDTVNDTIVARLAAADIAIGAALVGKIGEGKHRQPQTSHAALALEQQVLASHQSWLAGLSRLAVDASCRSIKLNPVGLEVEQPQDDQLRLTFTLPSGAFATAVLREVINVNEEQ